MKICDKRHVSPLLSQKSFETLGRAGSGIVYHPLLPYIPSAHEELKCTHVVVVVSNYSLSQYILAGHLMMSE